MNYLTQIEAMWEQLRKQSAEQKIASPARLTAQTESGALLAEMESVECLACAARSISFRPVTPCDTAGAAQQLAADVRYLTEPLLLMEFDKTADVAQIRSDPPAIDAQTRRYFELLVQPNEISLRRYEKTPGQPRRVIPAALTRDVVQRLATDFANAAVSPC